MIALRPGTVFAGYTIERRIGAGGWGVVYAARDPQLPRTVALKLLDFDRAGPDARIRFEREAELTAGLEHPDIVTIYERGFEDGILWIAMQYVDGSDASTLRAVEPERALQIGARIAAALDFAHAAGVLHRDVKPSNILVAPAAPGRPEQVLLVDFGIARLMEESSRLTVTGSITGTAAYVSPEQVAGGEVDHRSDQYSLACTLFVLLTGRPPFPATGPLALMHAHVYTAPISPGDVLAELAVLDEVFAKALAKQPEDRYDSCTEFVTAAQSAATAIAATRTAHALPRPPVDRAPTPARRTPSWRPAALVGATALLAGAALTGWMLTGAGPFDDNESAATAPATDSAFGWDPRHRPAAEAFPDLVGDKNADTGWNGTTCTENAPGKQENIVYRDNARISCRVNMSEDGDRLSFDILDRAGSAHADLSPNALFTALFDGCEPLVREIEHPSGTSHPVATCEGVDHDSEVDDADHQIYVWTLFPDKEQYRYVMVARWPGHTVNELIELWWQRAPLGE